MNQDEDGYRKYKALTGGRTSITAFNQQNEPHRKQRAMKKKMAPLSMDLILFAGIKHKSKTLKETQADEK